MISANAEFERIFRDITYNGRPVPEELDLSKCKELTPEKVLKCACIAMEVGRENFPDYKSIGNNLWEAENLKLNKENVRFERILDANNELIDGILDLDEMVLHDKQTPTKNFIQTSLQDLGLDALVVAAYIKNKKIISEMIATPVIRYVDMVPHHALRIHSLATEKKYNRKGLATSLLNLSSYIAKDLTLNKPEMFVFNYDPDSISAVRLYKKCGAVLDQGEAPSIEGNPRKQGTIYLR